MESLPIWLVLLHCFTLHNGVDCGIPFGFDDEFFIPQNVIESRQDNQEEASGALEDTTALSTTENALTSLPTPTPSAQTTPDEGQKAISNLTIEFRNSTTFTVTWQNTSGSLYSILIKDEGGKRTIHNESGILSSVWTLSTTTVPLKSFQEYALTVIDADSNAQATISFWSPPEPPNRPDFNLTTQPNELVLRWQTPSNAIRAVLEYWLRICKEDTEDDCEEFTAGADTQSFRYTTATVSTYTVELWASHRFVFGDFDAQSEVKRAKTKSCRANLSNDIQLNYDSKERSVKFLFVDDLFFDICDLGIVTELEVQWSGAQNSFTCESVLQHTNWDPSSESDPFKCKQEKDSGNYRCAIALSESQLDEFTDRQIVIKATDGRSRCAFARSNTVLVASIPGGAPLPPWLILGVATLVTMTTLGLLYKKREPLWTFATDIINTFNNKRNRCHNDVELPRVSYFKVQSPGELARFNEEYCAKKRDSNYEMSLEYAQIQQDSERLMADRSFGLQPDLRLKNRYKNVIPFNHNRVTLQAQNGEILSTYINASLVKGFDGRAKCIVCQGPKMESLEDFLRMLIEYDVTLIGSLLSTINIDTDQDKRQCSQYWPREVGASEEFGKFSVKLESESQYDCFIRRNLKISGPGTSHRVTQLHFFRWPDHGTPSRSEDLLTFLSVFRKMKRGTPVIHCSAGVGRSGTLVALDFLMDLLENGERATIPRVVAHLRTQRVSMIQTEEQYFFLYECVYSALNGKSDTKSLNGYLTHSM